MTGTQSKLLAAASAAHGALGDCLETARDCDDRPVPLLCIGTGETLENLCDAIRLVLEAANETGHPLYATAVKHLQENTA